MKSKKAILLLFASVMLIAGCDDDDDKTNGTPSGTNTTINVSAPNVSYPLPVVDNWENAKDSTLKRISANNPFVKVLDGFDQIWSMNQSKWRNGTALDEKGANGEVADYGNGPCVYFDGYKNNVDAIVANKKTYAKEEVRNENTWVANIKYVEDITASRTEEEALAAYYDDQRDKVYSIMEAFGPLANTYVNIVKPVTSISRTKSEMNTVLEEETVEDEGQGYGTVIDSELQGVVDVVHLNKNHAASSSPSKYFFASPRPWRMNSNGEVIEKVDSEGKALWETIGSGGSLEKTLESKGKIETGEKHFQQYESNVKVIPALKYARRKAEDGRGKDGAFPSGHTSAGYLSAFGFAYTTPERFSEFLTRAAQLGDNRIVTGMHSPLDVIGGRIQATAMTAAMLNDTNSQETLKTGYKNAGEVFGAKAAAAGKSLYDYANTVTEDYTFESAYSKDKFEDHDKNKAFYREKLTYGLPQTGTKGLKPVVPLGAEALLETKLPYLSATQRREVLYTTEIDSGYPVIDESNGWGRLDLVTAADGYGKFLTDVTVSMDATLGRFNSHDWWRNDINGTGLFTLEGTGTLTFTGNNSYTGGTIVKGGMLEAESTSAFGTGDLYVEKGNVLVDVNGALNIKKNFTVKDTAELDIQMDNDTIQVDVAGVANLDGSLSLDFSKYSITGTKNLTLINANSIEGKFDDVEVTTGYTVKIVYSDTTVIAEVTKN